MRDVTAPQAARRTVRGWRSLLFVPADQPRLMEKLPRGADAVILDLEDSVALPAKAQARVGVPAVVADLAARGIDVLVRINAPWRLAFDDLQAAVADGVRAIVVPKVEHADRVRTVSEMIGELEAERGMVAGAIGVIALVESPVALPRLHDIAAIDRVVGLALGSEDFSLRMGVAPSAVNLLLPCQTIALAAAAAGIMAFGLPVSLANFTDLGAYETGAKLGRETGMTGALCIHPAQVPIVNEAFGISGQEREEAERIVAAWDEAAARGDAVFSLDGRMIDLPVVNRARTLLRR
jgi:citrate lyase subunit beta/citryl-CoA lyase